VGRIRLKRREEERMRKKEGRGGETGERGMA
jgi:hypothetical protein